MFDAVVADEQLTEALVGELETIADAHARNCLATRAGGTTRIIQTISLTAGLPCRSALPTASPTKNRKARLDLFTRTS